VVVLQENQINLDKDTTLPNITRRRMMMRTEQRYNKPPPYRRPIHYYGDVDDDDDVDCNATNIRGNSPLLTPRREQKIQYFDDGVIRRCNSSDTNSCCCDTAETETTTTTMSSNANLVSPPSSPDGSTATSYTQTSSSNYSTYTHNNSWCILDEMTNKEKSDVCDLATLINNERRRRNLYPLERSPELDYLAREHCKLMANYCNLFHSVRTVHELQSLLSSTNVGENIQRDDTICDMYRSMMTTTTTTTTTVSLSSSSSSSSSSPTRCTRNSNTNRRNVLSKTFNEFGSAIYVGANDGKMYCCQFFRKVNY
jgi:Cysteine-rich secretory protein family